MTITGYSDRINHALAFAAKHHDQQVRKGTRLPYLTHPANVAIILTRYGRDDYTVVAGILHDVIEDCVLDAYPHSMLEQRIGDKFGRDVLDTVLAVTHRRVDDDGIELSHDDRRDDYLERLAPRQRIARDGSVPRTSCTTRTASWPISAARSIRTASGAASPAAKTHTIHGIAASTTG